MVRLVGIRLSARNQSELDTDRVAKLLKLLHLLKRSEERLIPDSATTGCPGQ